MRTPGSDHRLDPSQVVTRRLVMGRMWVRASVMSTSLRFRWPRCWRPHYEEEDLHPMRQAPTVPDAPGVQDHVHTLAELLSALDPDEGKAAPEVMEAYLSRLKR